MAALLRSSLRHYRLLSTTTTTCRPLTTSAVEPNLRPEQSAEETTSNLSGNEILHFPLGITFRRLTRSRKQAEIEALIESQKKNPEITDENFFSTLIQSYGLARMPDQASTLFNQMDDLGTPRSAISFNALLRAYESAWKFDEVTKLFAEIPEKHGISPDIVSYNILIRAYIKLDEVDKALLSLKQMEDEDIETTTTHYTLLIDAFYKKGKPDKAEELWEEMIEKGCLPDVAAYNVRVGYAHQGKPENVLALMEEMTAKGLKPDVTTYNHLYACYCKNDLMEEAERVYQSLEEHGCCANATTFRLGILQHCKKQNFERAVEVFKESMTRDKVPSFHSLAILVKGLVKSSRQEEAKEVIRAVKEKFPGNVLDKWRQLELELGLISDEDSPAQEEASA